MAITHNLGFPRIGARRELKFALEAYWKGELTQEELKAVRAQLRERHWQYQCDLDLAPIGDFSFYDQILDMSFTLGNVPERARSFQEGVGNELDTYFRLARGRSAGDAGDGVQAGEMTKWFDTNYHYIVPEFDKTTEFSLDSSRILEELAQATDLGVKAKPVLIGPLTYLWLGKTRDESNRIDLLPRLLTVYAELLAELAAHGVEWVQIDEPVLVTEVGEEWQQAFLTAYRTLNTRNVKILLATYFGKLLENLPLVCQLPVQGLHINAIHARDEVDEIVAQLPAERIISLGIINGRNIWKTDLNALLDWLEPLHRRLGQRLWIAPSCSLLHVPVDLAGERKLDAEIQGWLAFARQKLHELKLVATALNLGREAVQSELDENQACINSRQNSARVHNPVVKAALAQIKAELGQRRSSYAERSQKQRNLLNLPLYPTTTIGSFPQTAQIRHLRNQFRRNEINEAAYIDAIKAEIAHCIREQEALGLDVLVHGEAERNDMVEYFGEQLEGFVLSQFGWVQSYGSRCVKPPILFGDIRRVKSMTVDWTKYAQSLTDKPMKGMLTGPVTILNWSFVRDDQPRSTTCYHLALAIREEVLDLERAGIAIIQIDEAALREGLPLRRSGWKEYLGWTVEAFRIAANGVADETQIHTHMCYSEFNDIIAAIAEMDADVITIETSRSNMELLDAFDSFRYPNEIGPGVYDIHSPNIPSREQILQLMHQATKRISIERLWVNPDCGLKTRAWAEVIPALQNMVAAALELRRNSLLQ